MAKKEITGGTGLVGAYATGMLLARGERPVIFDVALNERLLNAVGVDPQQSYHDSWRYAGSAGANFRYPGQ